MRLKSYSIYGDKNTPPATLLTLFTNNKSEFTNTQLIFWFAQISLTPCVAALFNNIKRN
jgi:hypothetical protein